MASLSAEKAADSAQKGCRMDMEDQAVRNVDSDNAEEFDNAADFDNVANFHDTADSDSAEDSAVAGDSDAARGSDVAELVDSYCCVD
jgi:hypothetical protein